MIPELGKYAGPVLSAYGVSIVLMIGVVWLSLIQSSKARKALAEEEARHVKNG